MFSIVPKNPITPVHISEVGGETYSIFQNRKSLHQSINGFHVYINQFAWDAFINHSMNVYKQSKHEAQGIFLGKYFKDSFGEFAVATEYCEGVGESSHAYVGMSEECVAEISKKCSAEKLMMLIWIHTHPNFGVFYSGTDVNCLKTNFHMPFQSGIVVDIIRHESKGFKVDSGKNVIEFADYSIYNIPENRIFKPYEIKFEVRNSDLKKNESPPISEFLTKQFMEELQFLKKELGDLKNLINKKPEPPKPLLQVDTIAQNKVYFETEFKGIRQLLRERKDYTEDLQDIKQEQANTKKFLIWFILSLLTVFTLGTISIIYFVIKSFFRH